MDEKRLSGHPDSPVFTMDKDRKDKKGRKTDYRMDKGKTAVLVSALALALVSDMDRDKNRNKAAAFHRNHG